VLCSLAFVVAVMPLFGNPASQYANALYVFRKAAESLRLESVFSFASYVNTDSNTGSLRSAHYMAAVLLPLIVGTLAYAILRRRWSVLVVSMAAFLVFSMGENAHILAGAGAGLLAIAAVVTVPRRVPASILVVFALTCSIGIGTFAVAWNYFGGGFFTASPKARTYQLSLRYASEHPWRMLLGEGPAAFSSNAARKRMPASLSDERGFPMLPDFTPPVYGAIMREVHSAGTASTINRAQSGALGLLMEWGVAGTTIVLIVIGTLMQRSLRMYRASTEPAHRAVALSGYFMLPTLLTTLVFRPYFEYPDVMAVTSLLFLITLTGNFSRLKVERWVES
jgi:hypothetical protein